MKEKVCKKCLIKKNVDEFYNYSKYTLCKVCEIKKVIDYQRTKKGLITKIYATQRSSSKKRGDKLPDYTKKELQEWILSQPNFETLYNNWAESGYNKDLKPSCDRLDDYKPYTLDNIRLVTWEVNVKKGYEDRKNGINNKRSKAVIGTHKITGEIVEFYSLNEAERQTGVFHNNISKNCLGKYKSTGGYVWKYKI